MSYATPDATGRSLRVGVHVRITAPRHQYSGRTGEVVGLNRNRVWLRLAGGVVVAASRWSIGFTPRARGRRS